MQQVPDWWIWISVIYFVISIAWSVGLVIGLVIMYRKVMPIVTEARGQVQRIGEQAKSVASKASGTAELVHVQTQKLLGTANNAGSLVTTQARNVGAAITGVMIVARVVTFVRRLF